MVALVEDAVDFFQNIGRAGELRREFLERRDTALKTLLRYKRGVYKFKTGSLEDDLILYNALTLEASKLDNEYRLITGNESDSNYQGLIVMYNGVKNFIRKELKYRREHSRGV